MRSAKTWAVIAAMVVVVATSRGKAESLPPQIQLPDLNGRSGFTLEGIGGLDHCGAAVAPAGDLNGDGIVDMIIGARNSDNGSGEAYVVSGSRAGFPKALDLDDLDGTDGFVLTGTRPGGFFAASVAAAGDVNGDGRDDVLIGSPYARGESATAGRTYVLFGRDSYPTRLDISTLDGSDGFVVFGIEGVDLSGSCVAGIGDVNADGIPDIGIGAPIADRGLVEVGEAYVLYGTDTGFPAETLLSQLDGTNGFTMWGDRSRERGRFGSAIAAAGDVNGDGIDDFMVGAPGEVHNTGRAYIVYGDVSGFPTTFDLRTLDGTNGATLIGLSPADWAGFSLDAAGDVNADGITDLVIGAFGASDLKGESYVVFGRQGALPANFQLGNLNGTNGFTIEGIAAFDGVGATVAGPGDVNADGIDDLLIGSSYNLCHGYIVYGSDTGFPARLNVADLDGSNGSVLIAPQAVSSGLVVTAVGDLNADVANDILVGNSATQPAGAAYVVFGLPDCGAGNVTFGENPFDIVFVNGSNGGVDRRAEVASDELIAVTVVKPLAGNGRFVLHGDLGGLDAGTTSFLPAAIGATCYPFLLADGADPAIIANSAGKEPLVGESRFFGTPVDDPGPATTTLFYGTLPIGTELTLQAAIVNPSSPSSKRASVSNAVVLTIVP